MAWMDTDPAGNRLGVTIAEFGLTGGPGMGGCPQGPSSTPPNAPANVSGIPGDASLTATWDAATTIPGGSPVTGYVVEAQTAGDPNAAIFRRTVGAAALSAPITGLTNGTAYTVHVHATSCGEVSSNFGRACDDKTCRDHRVFADLNVVRNMTEIIKLAAFFDASFG